MRLSLTDRLFNYANIMIMLFLVVITLYPFYYVVMGSLSNSHKLMAHQGLLFAPIGFSLEAYERVLHNPNVINGYRNTFIILFLGTAVNLLFTSLTAYALSRKFLLRNSIVFGIVFTLFFSGGMIPSYLLINNTLHMGNTYWALILPVSISTWNLIVMRTSFSGISESLLESARIDGAGEWGILFRIVLPLSMPVIAVMILYYGDGYWNSWFSAMLYLRNSDMYPLQLVLRQILVEDNPQTMRIIGVGDRAAIAVSIKYAAIVVATVPILFVYPFLQKYFVKGVMIGALKE